MTDGAGNVIARRLIRQSPLDDGPDVPIGTIGHVEDEADGLVWVDFGDPYGTVACEASELIRRYVAHGLK
jgi:hypothetical protein